jgi:hypothetical protein
VFHDSSCVVLHYSIFLVHQAIGYSEWKRTFSNSNFEDGITHRGKNFQIESILSTIKDGILLDNRKGQIHEDMSETMMTWLEADRHHVGYLHEISDTRALLGQVADVCETATIWVDDSRDPRSTLGWAWMAYKHYLGESSRDLKQLSKEVLRVQNIQGWAYQDNDWPSGTNERGWHNQVPFQGPKELNDSKIDSKSSRWL